ncbi:MAG: DUF4097 family beta strand repeat-containing protein [Gammaproteobacteria bacterium]|nr:DUF4097 family beta strand repeat-containing protein [Gammaproteobacteria bacterium]
MHTTRILAAYLLVTASAISSWDSWAGEEVDRTLPVEPSGMVRIHNPRGDIEVHGWDRAEVRIDGELDDLAAGLTFEVDGDNTLIRVGLPEKNVNWGDGSELDIYLPTASALKIDSVSADIDVEEVTGAIAIRTVTGDVELADVGNDTRIKTVSGDVEVSEGSGILKVMTTSGDIKVDLDASIVTADTMSGSIELRLGDFDAATLGSVNGTMQITGRLNRSGTLSAETVSGDIELELTEPVNAKISATSKAGGSIDNDLTDTEPTRQGPTARLDTTSGDGSALIKLSTVVGSIELEEADAAP